MSFKWEKFSKKQLDFIENSTARINLATGAVRSGKTIASIVRLLEYIKTAPEGKLLFAGKTTRTLKRNVLNIIRDIVGKHNYSYNQGMGEAKIFDRKIYISGASDSRSTDKIQGLTLAGAYGDEISTWGKPFFNMLLSRCSVSGAKMFFTCNPKGQHHWLKTDFIDRQEQLDMKVFNFRLDDNLSLDEEYKENLKREYSGVFYDRYIKGEWKQASGLIYDMFNKKEHVVNSTPEIKKKYVGVDVGSNNPTAFVLVGLGVDDNLYILKEYKHSGSDTMSSKTDSDYTEDFIQWIGEHNPRWVAVDPSAKSMRLSLWRAKDKKACLKNTIKADNSVLDGIRNISSLISKSKLYVHARCKETLKELDSYSWDSTAEARGEDKPLKESDHLMDALRYSVMSMNNVLTRLLQ